jgi:hypothetical protein
MVSKINLDIALPGTSEPIRTKLLIPSPNLLVFIDQVSLGDRSLQTWADLLTEMQQRMGLDPEKVVWLLRKSDFFSGYTLMRIVADFYEGRFYDVRFVALQPQVDKYFRETIETPRSRFVVEGVPIFSQFPKPRLLSPQLLQIMLVVTAGLFMALALYTFKNTRSIRGEDSSYWQSKLSDRDEQEKSDASRMADIQAASSRADIALAKAQKEGMDLESRLEQTQAALALSQQLQKALLAKAAPPPLPLASTPSAPAPTSVAPTPTPPAGPIQVLPALPPGATASSKDVNLEDR